MIANEIEAQKEGKRRLRNQHNLLPAPKHANRWDGRDWIKRQNHVTKNSLLRVQTEENAPNQTIECKPTAPVPLESGCVKPVTLSILSNQEMKDCKTY